MGVGYLMDGGEGSLLTCSGSSSLNAANAIKVQWRLKLQPSRRIEKTNMLAAFRLFRGDTASVFVLVLELKHYETLLVLLYRQVQIRRVP